MILYRNVRRRSASRLGQRQCSRHRRHRCRRRRRSLQRQPDCSSQSYQPLYDQRNEPNATNITIKTVYLYSKRQYDKEYRSFAHDEYHSATTKPQFRMKKSTIRLDLVNCATTQRTDFPARLQQTRHTVVAKRYDHRRAHGIYSMHKNQQNKNKKPDRDCSLSSQRLESHRNKSHTLQTNTKKKQN
jgi:hypothetical protein